MYMYTIYIIHTHLQVLVCVCVCVCVCLPYGNVDVRGQHKEVLLSFYIAVPGRVEAQLLGVAFTS